MGVVAENFDQQLVQEAGPVYYPNSAFKKLLKL